MGLAATMDSVAGEAAGEVSVEMSLETVMDDVVDRDGEIPHERALWRSVAVPSEHGGWSLTIEPAVLGMWIEPSLAGVAIGLIGLVAFVMRTPLKLVLVDSKRHRWMDRTSLALRIAVVEALVLAALVVVAFVSADHPFWVPLAIAAPLMAVELWFGMNSRSRKLAPEMAGTIGIGSIAAAIVLAGGGSAAVATGAWLVIVARAAATIPFSRLQIRRIKGHEDPKAPTVVMQFVAIAMTIVGLWLGWLPVAAPVAVGLLALFQLEELQFDPPGAPMLGVQQMFVGLGTVAATALGVIYSM